jgi:hypothetical protein
MADKKFLTGVDLKSTLKISSITAGKALVINGSGVVTNSAVSETELGYIAGLTSAIQTQLNSKASQTDLDNHINDASGAHAASAISNVPAGNLAATDIQGAVNELQSDVDSRALDSVVIKKDGSVAYTAAQSMGGFKLTSVAAPTTGSDAANKSYVDSVAEGLKPKQAARVATTANIVIATALNAGDSIDGVTLANGDRVLVKDQTAAEENGIYVVSATPARSSDFDSLSPIDEINGSLVAVQEGTANQGKIYVQSGVVATLDTDDINFVIFNSSATLIGGDGITISGSNVSVDHDGQGLAFVSTQLSIELDGSTLSKSASGIKLSDTAVSAASYGSASETVTFTVDAQGRLTAASEQTISITSAEVSDFAEAAQDAVGTILVDSSSIDFTYNDGTPSITAVVLPAGVDHDSLQNFVANEHVDHSSVSIATAANSGLTGGGDITATRNLSVDINGTTAETVAADADKILIYDASASALKSMTRANFLAGIASGSAGDIEETAFAFADNQASVANVTGLVFAAATVRGFEVLASVKRGSTFETFKILGIQKSASFDISVESIGDDCGVTFSITNAGQIQYTSTNTGTAGTILFRAETTSVSLE